MASPKLTEKESLAIVEDMRQKRIQSVKDFFIGTAKAVTTDLPGFLMDVADKLAGDTSTLGEKDRSAQLFEKMTGIKTKSGSGGVDELVGGLVNPVGAVGAAKAIIIPAVLKDVNMYGEAIEASTKGMRGPELWEKFKVFPDPVTGALKSVIPDTEAKFAKDALKPFEHGYQSINANANPTRISGLAQDIFTAKTLPEIIDHPELFGTVPELAEVSVRPLILSSAYGSYDDVKDVIRLAGNRDPNDILSTNLHEIQHAVQKRVSDQGGGNTGMFFDNEETFSKAAERAADLARTLEAEFNTLFKGSPGLEPYSYPYTKLAMIQRDIDLNHPVLTPKAKEEAAKIPVATLKAYNQTKEAKDTAFVFRKAKDDAYENYRNLVGEAEARLVQTQHKLGDYTTYPPELMARELGVNVDELTKVLITDELVPSRKVDTSPEIKEAMEFVEKLIQSRASQSKSSK